MKEDLLIGSYSKNGIYKLNFRDNCLYEDNFENSYENCSYLYKSNNAIYSVTESSDNTTFLNGCVVSRNYDLSVKNVTPVLGNGPCHVTLDSNRNLLYISNYGDGSLNVFSINSDGSINKLIYKKSYTSHSHIHCSALSNDNKFLFVIDLGDNKLFAYKITNKFELEEKHCYKFDTDIEPRHLVISNNNIYVITESSCILYHLTFSDQNGFQFIKKASILPHGTKKQKDYTGCAIKISNDNKFIYISVRGHNSISVFNTSLELIQNISCEGSTPRDINFDTSQNFLFCANQNSSNISIFKINKNTGYLLFESKYPVNNPACIINL